MAPKKIHVAYVRLSAEDHAAITRLAGAADVSVAEFLRRRGLGCAVRAPVPAINRQAWTALARSAANINQLAHHLNENRITGQAGTVDAAVLRAELRRLYGHIAALRRLLIGETAS